MWSEGSAFRSSEWFTRGWTLQELIAPRKLVFLSQTWELLGTKAGLVWLVEEITGVPLEVLIDNDRLLHGWLDGCSVAQRMSWAARRRTTKVEDRAYSLLGIFNIQMPPLYGEGQRAFRRLQEDILRRIPDQTIFAWGNVFPEPFSPRTDPLWLTTTLPRTSTLVNYENLPRPPSPEAPLDDDHRHFNFSSCGFYMLLADSPDAFADAGQVAAVPPNAFHDLLRPHCKLYPQEYTSTPNGIRTDLPLLSLSSCLIPDKELFENEDWLWSGTVEWYLAVLACELHISSPSVPALKHLLCCVCCIPSPLRPVNSLYRSALKDRRGELGGPVEFRPLYSIFRLSLDNQYWGSTLRPHTVYLDHFARVPSYSSINSLDVTTLEPPISFTLPTWCRDALAGKGYVATLRVEGSPSDSEASGVGARIHRLTLTPCQVVVSDQLLSRWTVTADFNSERTPGGDGHGAAVHVAGRDGGHSRTEHLEWLHARDRHEWSPGWHWGLMSGMLVLAAEGHETVRLELGVRLASASCCRVHVAFDAPARRGSVHDS